MFCASELMAQELTPMTAGPIADREKPLSAANDSTEGRNRGFGFARLPEM
jgi:hypothetical protein